MTLQDKVIAGLEKTALSSGYPLTIELIKPNDVWLVEFKAGYATVRTALSTFVRQPKVLLDPFLEEVIKRNL